jgi:hypothetical protein
VLALFAKSVFDLEQVREVRRGLDVEVELERLSGVIEDDQVFVEALADPALAHDRERGLVVVRFRRRDEEELRREVVDIVGRENIRRSAVDGQAPLREKPGVLQKEPVRLVGRRDDVPAPVADDERIAFEDADRVRSHRRALSAA